MYQSRLSREFPRLGLYPSYHRQWERHCNVKPLALNIPSFGVVNLFTSLVTTVQDNCLRIIDFYCSVVLVI